jgi:hypothetical protein
MSEMNEQKSEEKVGGMTGSGGYVDEIMIIPEMLFNQLLSRMSVPGAKVFVSTNPSLVLDDVRDE